MKTLIATAAAAVLLSTAAIAGGSGEGAHGTKFIEEWDINGDGQVSADDVASRRADIFATFDENDDGVLSAAEYTTFDETRAAAHAEEDGMGNGGDRKAEVGFTLQFNDVNSDGKVTLEEFLSKSADWLAILDRNGDGVITTADFGPKG